MKIAHPDDKYRWAKSHQFDGMSIGPPAWGRLMPIDKNQEV
jgi:hypothetical protein